MKFLIAILAALPLHLFAATASLSTGASCAYDLVTITAGGGIAVTCAGGTPPVTPPVTPPITPPTVPVGNPGAILPPLNWPAGQASSDVSHIQKPSGLIFGYQLPPLHAGNSIAFTQGPDSNTCGQAVTEYSVSQTPGVIFTDGGTYYYKSGTGQNYNGITINLTGTAMPYAPPEAGAWYINIRWTYPHPSCGFSVQWAAASS